MASWGKRVRLRRLLNLGRIQCFDAISAPQSTSIWPPIIFFRQWNIISGLSSSRIETTVSLSFSSAIVQSIFTMRPQHYISNSPCLLQDIYILLLNLLL